MHKTFRQHGQEADKAIDLIDPIAGGSFSARFEVMHKRGGAEIGLAHFEADGQPFAVPLVLYADGAQYTVHDWQLAHGEACQAVDEPENAAWMDSVGRTAIKVDGLPRSLA